MTRMIANSDDSVDVNEQYENVVKLQMCRCLFRVPI